MLEIGSLVDGKYKILTKVGQGGMSVVYLALNEKANKQWAIKEVRKDGIKDFEVVKQGLVAETEILKKLNHPNLPSIIDVIDQDDSFIIIMDYIEGNSLNKALEEFGAQPQESVISWAKQLCDVLGYLHSRKSPIIYRDMKPANVMLKPDGNVTLIDFGTAREFKEKNLADTTCLGTVGYAAPEQFGGMGQTDARTDIYCLGATLYHLVTGMNPCEPPYEIKPIREINPTLSGGLERIILKCTQRDPNDRYQSAAELMYALEHYEEFDDIYRRKQKKKLGAFIATSALTLVCAGVTLFGYLGAEQKKGENYEYLLGTVTNASDYYNVILTDPSRTEAYLGSDDFDGLAEFLIKDGDLTREEYDILQKLKSGIEQENANGFKETVKPLEQLQNRNPEGFEAVCYEIGETILFYYDINVEKDKYAAAAAWFQYAGDEYPAAKVYCEISECLENIKKFEKGGQISKLYEQYTALWEKIKGLQTASTEYDDDLKLRVWNEMVNMIGNNAGEFCEVTTKEDITQVLKNIDNASSEITIAFLQENIAELKANIETTTKKLESIKTQSGS